MQKWLDDSIFMYSTHIESKSVVSERFIRTLENKIYKTVTANSKKSYLGSLNTCHCSIVKKSIDADNSALNKEIVTNLKSSKFKVGDRVRITKYKNSFSKSYTENCSKEIFVINSVLKTNPWMYKI